MYYLKVLNTEKEYRLGRDLTEVSNTLKDIYKDKLSEVSETYKECMYRVIKGDFTTVNALRHYFNNLNKDTIIITK